LSANDGTEHNLSLDADGKGVLKNIDFGRLIANQTKRSEGPA